MRGRLAVIALAGGLGLVTTVAVAWTSATFRIPAAGELKPYYLLEMHTKENSIVCTNSPFGGVRFACSSGERISWELEFVNAQDVGDGPKLGQMARTELSKFESAGLFPRAWGEPPNIGDGAYAKRSFPEWIQDARGWPFRALWCEWVCVPGRTSTHGAVGGLNLRPLPGAAPLESTLRALPLRPVYGGVALDSGIFAAIWLLALSAPGVIRPWLRSWRGGCPSCGYSLAGLAEGGACPECGRGRA